MYIYIYIYIYIYVYIYIYMVFKIKNIIAFNVSFQAFNNSHLKFLS